MPAPRAQKITWTPERYQKLFAATLAAHPEIKLVNILSFPPLASEKLIRLTNLGCRTTTRLPDTLVKARPMIQLRPGSGLSKRMYVFPFFYSYRPLHLCIMNLFLLMTHRKAKKIREEIAAGIRQPVAAPTPRKRRAEAVEANSDDEYPPATPVKKQRPTAPGGLTTPPNSSFGGRKRAAPPAATTSAGRGRAPKRGGGRGPGGGGRGRGKDVVKEELDSSDDDEREDTPEEPYSCESDSESSGEQLQQQLEEVEEFDVGVMTADGGWVH